MAYDNNLRGALFKNEKKQKETHPDYRGSITIGGVEYWLDAWIKEPKEGGKKFMSLSAKPKNAQAVPQEKPPETQEIEF